MVVRRTLLAVEYAVSVAENIPLNTMHRTSASHIMAVTVVDADNNAFGLFINYFFTP